MAKLSRLILLLLLTTSCAKITHEIKGLNGTDVTVGPDFKSAAAFCDERYGEKTEEAEQCFLDYRNYYTLKLSVDMNTIIDFCEQYYAQESNNKMQACVDDLQSMFKTFQTGSK